MGEIRFWVRIILFHFSPFTCILFHFLSRGPGCDGYFWHFRQGTIRGFRQFLFHTMGQRHTKTCGKKCDRFGDFVGDHYLEDFDFFFRGGEDLYVLPQNPRSFLAEQVSDPTTHKTFSGAAAFSISEALDMPSRRQHCGNWSPPAWTTQSVSHKKNPPWRTFLLHDA